MCMKCCQLCRMAATSNGLAPGCSLFHWFSEKNNHGSHHPAKTFCRGWLAWAEPLRTQKALHRVQELAQDLPTFIVFPGLSTLQASAPWHVFDSLETFFLLFLSEASAHTPSTHTSVWGICTHPIQTQPAHLILRFFQELHPHCQPQGGCFPSQPQTVSVLLKLWY